MESLEKVPCVCGKGFLEVRSTLYGKWRVDSVAIGCNICGSDDVLKAREEMAKATQKPDKADKPDK